MFGISQVVPAIRSSEPHSPPANLLHRFDVAGLPAFVDRRLGWPIEPEDREIAFARDSRLPPGFAGVPSAKGFVFAQSAKSIRRRSKSGSVERKAGRCRSIVERPGLRARADGHAVFDVERRQGNFLRRQQFGDGS